MKKLLILALMTMLLPANVMAMKMMDHTDAKGMKHDEMKMDQNSKAMGQGSMGMQGVILLEDDVVDGVKAAAHLMEGKNGMGQMLMVMFTDAKTGAMISSGRVALKIESPDEKVGGAQAMMNSKGMFGASVQLTQKGVYHFRIGSKLKDGKKRSFHFHYAG